MTQATAEIGHNNPPSEIEILKETLAERNAKALNRAKSLNEAAGRVPDEVKDQATADKITDLEKLIGTCLKALDDGHEAEKKPFLTMGRVVDDFFRDPRVTLEAAKKRIKGIQTRFLVDKESAERKRRLAEEEKRRQEAAVTLQAAQKLEGEGKAAAAEVMLEQAVAIDDDAAFFAAAATQKGQAMAVSKGEATGAKSSLRYIKTGELLDKNVVDLEVLRPYIKPEHIQVAINMAVKAGVKEIKGVKIWDKPEAATR